MTRDYGKAWSILPDDLKTRLVANPDLEITDKHAILALVKAGVLVAGVHWAEEEGSPKGWTLDRQFRDYVRKIAQG